MILARIVNHLKTQNWTAVALEFVIVVAGVVIGFQVTAWGTAQQDRVDEHHILLRLQDEAHSLLESRTTASGRVRDRDSVLTDTRRIIFLGESDQSLTEVQCSAIAGSHVYIAPADGLATLEDLLATGRLDLIGNEDVRHAISGYLLTRETTRNYSAAINNQLFRLANRHPDMIRLELESNDGPDDTDGITRQLACDTDAMRASNGFRNDFLDNSARYAGHSTSIVLVNDALAELVSVLDAELGGNVQ